MNSELVFLNHILEQADYIIEISEKITRSDFEKNRMYQYTFVRAMEILGEAAKHVSEKTRNEFPNIPFRDMAGLRDRLIHGYFSVDIGRVWEIAENDIPPLKAQIEELIQKFC